MSYLSQEAMIELQIKGKLLPCQLNYLAIKQFLETFPSAESTELLVEEVWGLDLYVFLYFPLRHDFSTTLFPHLLPLFPFLVRELGGCAWTGFQAGLSQEVLQEGQADTDHVQRLKACFSAPFPGLVFDPHHSQGFPVTRTSNLFRNILNSCDL